jgi:LacI family transcriptional regulator
MTTVRDIALEAGVSAMTVSNVINGRHDKVSAATIERVRAIMDRRGYVPNASARALSANRSNIIALVYRSSNDDGDPLANPHDAAFVGEVERQVSGSGRHLMIRAAEDIARTAANLRSWRVDGAIFIGTLGGEVDDLRRHLGIPVVFVDNYSRSPQVSKVGIDDFQGGFLAARHLLLAGHERLGFIGPHIEEVGVIRERYDGFRAALAESAPNHADITVLECSSRFQDGRDLATRLSDHPARPTGLFATADIIAVGLLNGFLGAGVTVPEEVSLVGFDDTPEATHVFPALTTIRQDVGMKAQAAVEMLIGLIDAEGSALPQERVTLEVTVVPRATVGPPPGARRSRRAR